MASDSIERLRRLPIQVPLQAGERPLSFVRRLATANHLRTSYLLGYLARKGGGHTAAIDINRLSLATGRTVDALRHVFPDFQHPAKPVTPTDTQTGDQDPADADPITSEVRQTAADDGVVITLGVRFKLPRPTIIKALLGERPDWADDPARTNRKLRAVAGVIDSMLAAAPGVAAKQIWRDLTSRHGVVVSYGTVRSYVNRARARADDPRAAQYLLSRTALYDLIRQHAHGHDLVADLQARFAVDRDHIVAALTSKALWSEKAYTAPKPPRPRQSRRILFEHEAHIDELLLQNPDLRVCEIRDHLLDERHIDVSYGTVRDYIARRQRDRERSNGPD